MGLVGASSNLYDPLVNVGDDEVYEWIYSGKFDSGVQINNIEEAFNEYVFNNPISQNGIDIPIVISGTPNEQVFLNGIQLYLDSIPGDNEPDGDVDLVDLSVFSSEWLKSDCNNPDWCNHSDLDYDGKIDLLDFSRFANHWQETRP